MKRVLISVLSSRHRPYDMLLDCALRTWNQRKVDGVETFFYTGLPDTPKLDGVVTFPIDEGLFTIGRRTLEAFKLALSQYQFDYLARVNASCYVRKQKLLDYAQTLPESGVVVGLIVESGPEKRPFIWGGGQYIYSRDIVRMIVDNAGKWDHRQMEDVAVSWLLSDLGIPTIKGKACSLDKKGDGWICTSYGGQRSTYEMADISEFAKDNDHFFIRVKQDSNRYGDVKLMHQLYALGL